MLIDVVNQGLFARATSGLRPRIAPFHYRCRSSQACERQCVEDRLHLACTEGFMYEVGVHRFSRVKLEAFHVFDGHKIGQFCVRHAGRFRRALTLWSLCPLALPLAGCTRTRAASRLLRGSGLLTLIARDEAWMCLGMTDHATDVEILQTRVRPIRECLKFCLPLRIGHLALAASAARLRSALSLCAFCLAGKVRAVAAIRDVRGDAGDECGLGATARQAQLASMQGQDDLCAMEDKI